MRKKNPLDANKNIASLIMIMIASEKKKIRTVRKGYDRVVETKHFFRGMRTTAEGMVK